MADDQLGFEANACRARQGRLLQVMQQQRVDWAIVTQIEHIQYLTGARLASTFSPVAALAADGRLTLVVPNNFKGDAAADDLLKYEAKSLSTLRNDQRAKSSAVLIAALPQLKGARIGVEFSSFGPHLAQPLRGTLVDLEPDLYRLRRRKDPDELARLRKAIAATGKMYETARSMMAPGLNELDLFNELQSVAVRALDEMLTGTGNDYACGERGGAPRNRAAQAGELYILDLGPAYRGYFADNARTIAVNRQPTEVQQRAWEAILPVFAHVQATVRPGKNCHELFNEAQAILDATGFRFDHHLGHGIGLYPHEAPHLNPHWDDVFEVGDVFACEPGLYDPALRGGIRLENNYRVTENGVELLSDFPLEL